MSNPELPQSTSPEKSGDSQEQALDQDERTQIVARWRSITEKLDSGKTSNDERRSIINSDEYAGAKEAYLDQIERCYADFISQNGVVAPSGIKDYLLVWQKFSNFLSQLEEEIPFEQRPGKYDLGYRFLTDALLNGDNAISEEWRTKFEGLFFSLGPYYGHLFHLQDQVISEFVEKSRGKSGLINITKHLVKRAWKQWLVTRSGEKMANENSSKWNTIYENCPVTDATFNCAPQRVVLHPLIRALGIEEKEYWEIIREAEDEYRSEFAAEFETEK